MNELRQSEPARRKQHCFSLLHDAVRFTEDRLDEMSNDSLLGYITLAAITMKSKVPEFGDIRADLLNLGFNVVPPNMRN